MTCRASFCHKAFLANHFKNRVGQNRQAVCAFTSCFLHQLHFGFRQQKLNKYRPKDMSTHLTGPSRLHMLSHAALGKLGKPQTCSSKAAKEVPTCYFHGSLAATSANRSMLASSTRSRLQQRSRRSPSLETRTGI